MKADDNDGPANKLKSKTKKPAATSQQVLLKEYTKQMKENQNELLVQLKREQLEADQNMLQNMERLVMTQTSILLQGLQSWHVPVPLSQHPPNLEHHIASVPTVPSQASTLFPRFYNPSLLPTQSMYAREGMISSESTPHASLISHSVKNATDVILNSMDTNGPQSSQDNNVQLSTIAQSSGDGLSPRAYSNNGGPGQQQHQVKKRKMDRETIDSPKERCQAQPSVNTSSKILPTVENIQVIHEAQLEEEIEVSAGMQIEIPEDMILNEAVTYHFRPN